MRPGPADLPYGSDTAAERVSSERPGTVSSFSHTRGPSGPAALRGGQRAAALQGQNLQAAKVLSVRVGLVPLTTGAGMLTEKT